MKQSPKIKEHPTYRHIYAFDSTTSNMPSELSSADSPITIHTHCPYAPYCLRFQFAVLALSPLKSLEIYTLFILGGTHPLRLALPLLFLLWRVFRNPRHHHLRPLR